MGRGGPSLLQPPPQTKGMGDGGVVLSLPGPSAPLHAQGRGGISARMGTGRGIWHWGAPLAPWGGAASGCPPPRPPWGAGDSICWCGDMGGIGLSDAGCAAGCTGGGGGCGGMGVVVPPPPRHGAGCGAGNGGVGVMERGWERWRGRLAGKRGRAETTSERRVVLGLCYSFGAPQQPALPFPFKKPPPALSTPVCPWRVWG